MMPDKNLELYENQLEADLMSTAAKYFEENEASSGDKAASFLAVSMRLLVKGVEMCDKYLDIEEEVGQQFRMIVLNDLMNILLYEK